MSRSMHGTNGRKRAERSNEERTEQTTTGTDQQGGISAENQLLNLGIVERLIRPSTQSASRAVIVSVDDVTFVRD